MNATDKALMFETVRVAIHFAEACAREMNYNIQNITPDQASELLRRCRKVDAAATAFERAIRGVEIPKVG